MDSYGLIVIGTGTAPISHYHMPDCLTGRKSMLPPCV
jgi:hypothetical protein